jgi:hypothetical protein
MASNMVTIRVEHKADSEIRDACRFTGTTMIYFTEIREIT